MANSGNSRDDDAPSRQDRWNRPVSSDADEEWEELETEPSKATGLGGVLAKLKRNRWVKKNPNLIIGIAVGALLLLVVLFFSRQQQFGGEEDKKGAAVVVQPLPPAPKAVLPPAATPANPAREPPKLPAQPSQGQPKKEEPEKEQNPPLPDDVAEWKQEDYFRARAEDDPRLLEAVVHLGKKARDSEWAAQGLAELLKPLPTESPGAAGPLPGSELPPGVGPLPGSQLPPGVGPPPASVPPSVPGSPPSKPRPRNPADLTKLVEAIVAALGDIGTDAARKTLEQILSGELTTDDNKAAVEAALKTLIGHPTKKNNILLLWALMGPDALRPEDHQGAVPAQDLQQKAFDLVKMSTSCELRADLVKILIDNSAWMVAPDPMRDFLLAPDPLNCGAQIVLYQNKDTGREVRAKLEQQLISYGGFALAQLLDISDQAVTGIGQFGFAGGAPDKPDANLGAQVAGLLWSEKFRSMLEPQLNELRSFEKQAQLVLLAGTIPHDSTRAAVARLLRRHWDDGPMVLEAAGLADRVITDPGLVVTLKTLPRKDPKQGSGYAAPRTAWPTRPGAGGRTAAEVINPIQKREQAEQDWMSISSKLVAAWCKRLDAAALLKEKAMAKAHRRADDTAPKLPADITLSSYAEVIASYHVLWPDDAPAEMAGQKPSRLEIYYVRAEENGKPKKVLGYYARQAQVRPSESHMIDRATWVDSLRVLPNGRRRSLDVLLTRSDKQGQSADTAKDDKETDFTVEILSIEIKAPNSRE